MNKEKFEKTKGTVGNVITIISKIGVSMVVDDFVQSVMPEDVKPVWKIFRKIGGMTIDGMLAKPIENHVNELMERIQYPEIQQEEVKEDTEDGRTEEDRE